MAAITAVTRHVSRGVREILWEAMGDSDLGSAVECADLPDKTIQAIGTFGSATVTLQGTNDPAASPVWTILTDRQGVDITFAAAGISAIAENPARVRVITTGGSGADIDVYMIAVASLPGGR